MFYRRGKSAKAKIYPIARRKTYQPRRYRGGGIQLIFASELEISSSSSQNFDDAESSIKKMAASLGFNAVVNVERSHHTEGMHTQGAEQTKTKYNKSFWDSKEINSSSSTTAINTHTTIDNVFTVKGVLALIGREDPISGEEYIYENFEQVCAECYEFVHTLQQIHAAADELRGIKLPVKYMIIGLLILFLFLSSFSTTLGLIAFGIYYLFIFLAFFIAKQTEKKAYEVFASLDAKLKSMIDIFRKDTFAAYAASPYVTLKHVGE